METRETFAAFADEFIRATFEAHPTRAVVLGLHEYDGRADDCSPEAMAARARALHGFRRRLEAFDRSALGRLEAYDAALIETAIDLEAFRLEALREHARNPMVYADLLDVSPYIKRRYAPLPERARALAAHLREVPRVLDDARRGLTDPVPRTFRSTAVEMFEGQKAFIRDDLPAALRDLDGDPRREVDRAAGDAVRAIDAFLAYLAETIAPRTTDDFAIGADRFGAMLRAGERVDLSLDELLGVGEAELARLGEAVRETVARIDPAATPGEAMRALGRDHPAADRLLVETRGTLDGLRRFLVERDLVTVPAVDALVDETPPFMRWAFAMMDTVGPFERTATESYYYVTPPDRSWSPEQQAQWLTKFDRATLTIVSIHEAYPGHYVHFAAANRAPTRAARIFETYSCFEGWAHYAEELMVAEQEYGGGDPRLRLAYLSEALLRVVRYLAAIRMHAHGMTVDQATQRFIEDAYMEPLPARKEAERGTHDPQYLNYTLGKLMVLKLRADVRREQDGAFRLRDFHDRFIGLGTPPVPVARRMLLERDDGRVL